MKKERMYDFFIWSVLTVAKTVEFVDKDNKYENLIWRCVYRAHRDVLSGRKYVAEYSSCKDGNGVNNLVHDLYSSINGCYKKNKIVDPRLEIKKLKDTYSDVKLGAIQKLVNMSLKYLVVLNTYEKLKVKFVDESICDCPLDSIILKKTENYKNVKWTLLDNFDEYVHIQDEIARITKDNKLGFDFDNWVN